MFQKRPAGNLLQLLQLLQLLLLVLLSAVLAACNPGSTPTATPVTEPAATVVATGPDGAWRSAYDYTQWEQLSVRPQGRMSSAALAGPNVIYLTGHTGCLSGAPITLQRSTDGGKTWQQTTKGEVPLIVVAPNEKLAYGTTCGGIARTTDSGATWTELPGSKLTNYDPDALAASPDGQTVFAAHYSEGGTARITRSP